MKTEEYALLSPVDQENFFYLEISSAWLVQADLTYDVRHIPASHELILIQTHSGRGELQCADQATLSVTAGTLTAIKSSTLIRYRTMEMPWIFSWWTGRELGLRPFELKRIYEVTGEHSPEDSRQIIRLLQSPSAVRRRQGMAVFQELLWQWLPNYNRSLSQLAPALEKMHYYLDQNVEMRELARCCGMSLRHFRRCFHEETGKGPKEYWNELRLHTALGLLKNRGKMLKEVAAELGFSSSFHLSNALKKRFGAAPRNLLTGNSG